MKSARCCWSLLLVGAVAPVVWAQEPPSFAKNVGPFFVKYCTECHNDKKANGGLSLESYKSLLEGGEHGAAVIPGKADESRLVLMLEGLQEPKMPTQKAALHPKKTEIPIVRAWVNAGAKLDQEVKKVVLPAIQSKVKAAPPVTALAYLPDGKHLIAGCYKDLLLCDVAKGEIVGKLSGLPQPVTALTISKNGSWLAVALGQPGVPARILLYPLPGSGALVWGESQVLADAHADVIHDVAFSPDGKSLISIGYDRLVKIWNMPEGKNLKTLKEHSDSVYGVTFRPDGKLLATAAADRAVKVWQVGSGKLLYTLGENTDWVYAVAWSPDGKHLAAGGVDKSIRVWEVGESEGKVVQSVFAHQGPVLRLIYSQDGKTLYSLSEDRTVKAWDTKTMSERQIYPAQPEALLALAVQPKGKQLALGRYDGALLLLDEATGKVQAQPVPTKGKDIPTIKVAIQEIEPNNSPGTGQKISLPATVVGAIDKAGDVDYFRFEAKAGQEFGVKVIAIESMSKPAFQPFLQLTDGNGAVLAQAEDKYLGYKFAADGWYAIGIHDRDFNGSSGMKYELRVGDVPVVTAVFPQGLQQGTEADIRIDGVNLGGVKTVKVKAEPQTAPGTKLPIPFKAVKDAPLGLKPLVVGEFPEVLQQADKTLAMPVPGTANGVIAAAGQTDTWKFHAKKGQKLIVEVNARRLGSELDSYIEILDAQGKLVPQATLRSLAKTFVTFRDHNSVAPGIRIDAWTELATNDYIYVGTELLKIKALPPNPDADCSFFSDKGKRLGFLGTTPTNLTKGDSMYKVSIHPPGTTFPPNGFPVVTLFYRNDDGGADYGRDSRLFFEPPADGEFQVRIGDSSGKGGSNYAYRLTIHPPRPSFNVRFNPTTPSISKGSAIPITVNVDRFDGYAGPIKVWFESLPPGFSAPATEILHDEEATTFALWADKMAKTPAKGQPLKLIAEAVIAGKSMRKEATGGMIQVLEPGDLVTTTEQAEVSIKPGGHAKLTLHIERRNGFKGRVPVTVQGLPHGVKVLDIGLNGILITEKESQRTIEFYCEPWVHALEHPIVISAQREGKGTQHAAKSVLLKVGGSAGN